MSGLDENKQGREVGGKVRSGKLNSIKIASEVFNIKSRHVHQ